MVLVDNILTSWQHQIAAGLMMTLDLIEKTSEETWLADVEGHKYWHILIHGLAGLEYYFNDIDPEIMDLRRDFKFNVFGTKMINPFLEGPPSEVITQEEMVDYIYYLSSKLTRLLEIFSEDVLLQPSRFILMEMSRVELIDYAIRHFVSYLGQAIGYLRRAEGISIQWVVKAQLPVPSSD